MATEFKDLIEKAYAAFNSSDGIVNNIYTFENGLIKKMDIELV